MLPILLDLFAKLAGDKHFSYLDQLHKLRTIEQPTLFWNYLHIPSSWCGVITEIFQWVSIQYCQCNQNGFYHNCHSWKVSERPDDLFRRLCEHNNRLQKNGQLKHRAIFLSQYNYGIEFSASTQIVTVDALSRLIHTYIGVPQRHRK